jgi:DNA polymerase
MASSIYGVPVDEVTKDQRFVGKVTILGAGYGMGAVRFKEQLKTFGFDMELEEARRVISIYRTANGKINQVWRDAQSMVKQLANGDTLQIGLEGVLEVIGAEKAIRIPSGLLLRYDDLEAEYTAEGLEYTYKTRRGRTRIYGGKVVENVCQAIARCIIGEQMLQIAKRYRVVLTVHDSVVCCVPDAEVAEAQTYIDMCMRKTPSWAAGLPLDCESLTGQSYGDCE